MALRPPYIRSSDGCIRQGAEVVASDLPALGLDGADLSFIRIDNEVRLQFDQVEFVILGSFRLLLRPPGSRTPVRRLPRNRRVSLGQCSTHVGPGVRKWHRYRGGARPSLRGMVGGRAGFTDDRLPARRQRDCVALAVGHLCPGRRWTDCFAAGRVQLNAINCRDDGLSVVPQLARCVRAVCRSCGQLTGTSYSEAGYVPDPDVARWRSPYPITDGPVYEAKKALDSARALRLLRRRCTRPVMSTDKQPKKYRSLTTTTGPVIQDNGVTTMKTTHRPRRMSARTTALANQGKTGTKMGQLPGTGGQSE
jgi:hypothetical protein